MLLAQVPFRITRIITAIVLTRSLSASELGLAAVAMTAYETIGVLSSNGLLAKIVQASDDDVAELASTAYWLSWLVYIAMALVQLSAAIGLSFYFHNSVIFLAIAGMSLIYLSTPLSVVQAALLQREGRLGVLAFGSSAQMTTDNILCCGLALSGFGFWAILIPKLLVMPIWVVVVRSQHAWRNHQPFTMKRWRDFYEFGRHFLPVELLGAFRGNIDNVVIGSMLGVEALGLYYFAFNAGLGLSLSVINAAGDPIYSKLCRAVRGDKAALQEQFMKSLKLLVLIVTPVIVIQAVLVPFYVPFVFGPAWVNAVPIVALICLSALPRPLMVVGSYLLRAIGRPDLDLRWNISFTALLTIAIVIGAVWSVTGVATAIVIVNFVAIPIFLALVVTKVFDDAELTRQFNIRTGPISPAQVS